MIILLPPLMNYVMWVFTARKSIKEQTHKLIVEKIGSGDKVYQAFINISRPVVICLDALGESLDQHFREKFNISFSDLMGDICCRISSYFYRTGYGKAKSGCLFNQYAHGDLICP